MKKHNKRLPGGPFAQAKKNVEAFGSNLYYIALLQESLSQIEEARAEYETALSSSDVKTIKTAKMQLDFLHTVFDSAAIGIVNDEHSC